MWIFVKLTPTDSLEEGAREAVEDKEDKGGEVPDWKQLIKSREGWARVGHQYVMEWKMVWKDVTFGFTIAGIIAAFVPRSFFETLFVGSGSDDPAFYEVLLQCLVGPVAAFFTFIGSMGNIPLAALLYGNGVAFGGVMAFIFSDLVVFPVLRINAKYYGWKMSLYILLTMLVALVVSSLVLHYGFEWSGLSPQAPSSGQSPGDQQLFKVDHTLFLNLAFLVVTGGLTWLWRSTDTQDSGGAMADKDWLERALFWLAMAAYLWLAGGLLVHVVRL
jgi:hypothetical protein